jgi:hypothetical protein
MAAPVPDAWLRGAQRTWLAIHERHPQTSPPETVETIKDLALAHPSGSCNRIEAMLALEGIRVSSITIGKSLQRERPGHALRPLAGAGGATGRAQA